MEEVRITFNEISRDLVCHFHLATPELPTDHNASSQRNECDPSSQGALNLDGFVKGMWRIDEELRRTQAQTFKSTSTNSLGLYRHQSTRLTPASAPIPAGALPPKLPPRYKDILR